MKIKIPERAVEILKQAIENIEKRNASYNGNGINYEDYKLTGFESTWEDILECFARLWNNKSPDKAADWVAYSALQAAFVEMGMPQSRASKIFKKYLSGIYMNIKKIDEDEQRRRRKASNSLG